MKILSTEMAGNYQHRSLQRGHLVFTSLICYNGKLIFLDSHLERLLKGADFLFPKFGWIQKQEELKRYIENAIGPTTILADDNYYFRLTIFDDSIFMERRTWEKNEDFLRMTTALKIKTPGLFPSFLKLSNYVEADLELSLARIKNYDDILFVDNSDNITEASTSNIFVVKSDGTIISPSPSSMILDGIMRKKLFEKLQNFGFNIQEAPLKREELLKAREIWLTNSVKGLRFVLQYEDSVFEKENSTFQKVIEIFGRYGELV
jgi:branched-subunit amino acid aminotransferase/4-amino-4-deoxychorismate lyase